MGKTRAESIDQVDILAVATLEQLGITIPLLKSYLDKLEGQIHSEKSTLDYLMERIDYVRAQIAQEELMGVEALPEIYKELLIKSKQRCQKAEDYMRPLLDKLAALLEALKS